MLGSRMKICKGSTLEAECHDGGEGRFAGINRPPFRNVFPNLEMRHVARTHSYKRFNKHRLALVVSITSRLHYLGTRIIFVTKLG